jgi:uncharacterized membrane protein YedE/YeeE
MDSAARVYTVYIITGLALGALLVLSGFANYEELHAMFRLENMRLLLTFAGGVSLSALVFVLLRLSGRLQFEKKTLHPGILPGSMAFGFGWAITGACPSVMLAQLGEGRLPALATMAGMVVGIYLYRYLQPRVLRWDSGTCGA